MIPLRLDGNGPAASFLHANGFPPAAYLPFLRRLSTRLSVTAYPMRPLLGGPVDSSVQWSDLGHDLAGWIESETIAIGHSFGATASMTAVADYPDRFRALVLIEPAMVQRWQHRVLRLLPYGLCKRMGPARSTLSKRHHWPDRQAFLASCERSGLYGDFSPEALEVFADGALRPTEDGVRLVYRPDWEAHFYTNPPWPAPVLERVSAPVVGVRGKTSLFLDDSRWADLTATQPNGWFRQASEGAHLLPLEEPELTAELVLSGLEAQGVL